jgi:hypothetical protein
MEEKCEEVKWSDLGAIHLQVKYHGKSPTKEQMDT